MKQHHSRINKSSFLAVLFFAIMTAIGYNAANAQDTINPLFATTGPNVMGNGELQWNTHLEWYHEKINSQWMQTNLHLLGGNTNLRWGVGSRAELTLGFMGYHANGYYNDTNRVDPKNLTCAPSIGAKLLLYEGKGWLPRISFKTDLAVAFSHTIYSQSTFRVQPTIGLAFRNNIGRRWVIDYDLNFTWNSMLPVMINPVSGSLYARWLATDKLMVSAGFSSGTWAEPFSGDFELRYQASPNLQLFLQGGYAGMSQNVLYQGTSQAHVLTGVSWKL